MSGTGIILVLWQLNSVSNPVYIICLAVVHPMKKMFSMRKERFPQHDKYTQNSHQNIAGLQHCHLRSQQLMCPENSDR